MIIWSHPTLMASTGVFSAPDGMIVAQQDDAPTKLITTACCDKLPAEYGPEDEWEDLKSLYYQSA